MTTSKEFIKDSEARRTATLEGARIVADAAAASALTAAEISAECNGRALIYVGGGEYITVAKDGLENWHYCITAKLARKLIADHKAGLVQ